MGDTKRSTARAPRPPTKTAARKTGAPSVNDSNGDASSRQRVISATIESIVELGYYQATSNEIARRAGVSWGVIQYYFGTRENLLVAVIEDACATTLDELNDAEITGDTVTERLESWFDSVHSFYAQPGYIAILQILWDVLRRPGTASESKATLLQWQADIQARLQELLDEVAGRRVDQMLLLWSTSWGVAVAEAFGRGYEDVMGPYQPLPRRELIEAFAWMIERDKPKRPVRKPVKKKATAR